MAKQIKAALVAAVIVFVTAATLGGGWALTWSAMTTAGTAAFMAATTFIGTLATSVIGKMTSKGIDASAGNFGSKFATRAPLAPRQIVYGECRVGGTMVHVETAGVDNHMLHMIVAVAGHEIESIETVRFNDIDLTSTTSTINGQEVHTATNSDFTNTENGNSFGSGRLIRFTKHKGADDQAADNFAIQSLAGTSGSITSTDRFRGVAYVYLQMIFDAEKFGGGLPAISFKVKGKNIYDPRTSANATTDLQRQNPALIIRDYLTNTQYGLKAKASEINDTTNAGGFASAANTCDQTVTLADGSSTERRYTANGFTNFSANGNGVLESVLSSMAGKMSYVNGQFTVFAGATQTPSLTITDDELLSPLAVTTNSSQGDLYNSVKPIYVDASLNFTSTDAEVFQDSTFLAADTPSGESTTNYVKQMETQLPFTVTDTMAQRLGRIALKSQRQTTSLSVLVSLQFMRLQPNDWVYLTNERLGYSQKIFEVLSTNMEVMQDVDVPVLATRLELKEINTAVFNFATNDYTTPQAEGSNVSTGTYAVTAPSNLALAQQNAIDGTTSKIDILATWTNNTSDKVTFTEIEYKLSTDSNYTSDFTVGKRISVASIPNVVVGKEYNVRIRHIDLNGVTSAFTNAVNITIGAASSSPSVPSNLTATTGRGNILVSWTNPNNSDLRSVKVYRKTANSTPTDDTELVETIGGMPNKISTTLFGDADGLTAGVTYYFWVRAVNHSDQHSAFSSSVAGNFSSAVPDGTITTLKLAAEAVTNAKIAVDAIQGDVIAAGAIVEAKLGVDAVTNAKIADNAVDTAQIAADAVETAKIADNAVTNALIATDAVNQDSIAANSVTASEILAGTISATEIATNAITTIKINANAITTAKINAGAITADEIASNAVTAVKIIADAITTDKIAANAITAAKITANTITASEIAANTITATQILAGTITANELAADSVTASKITVSTLAGITANLGTITAGTIDATNVTISNLDASNISTGNLDAQRLTLNGSTLTVDGNGLKIGGFDAFTHVNANTLGNIQGNGGNDVAMTDTQNLVSSIFVNSSPHHIAKSSSSSADPTVAAGNVMGGTSNNANGSPLFTDSFTTPAFSGNREYLILVTMNPVGSFDSDSATMFSYAMRATSSATAYTSTSASDYTSTRGTSIGGSNSGAPYLMTDVVTLTGNTTYHIWTFGQLEDVGTGGHPSVSRGILDGAIQVSGLSK